MKVHFTFHITKLSKVLLIPHEADPSAKGKEITSFFNNLMNLSKVYIK